MKNKLPKLLALFACIFLGGMVYGQSADTPTQESPTVIPTFSTPEEKAKWIAEHPDEYAKAQAEAAAKNAADQTSQPAPATSSEHYLPEGFPVYINTGDSEKDGADYCARKAAWIAAHPEEYEKMKNPNQ